MSNLYFGSTVNGDLCTFAPLRVFDFDGTGVEGTAAVLGWVPLELCDCSSTSRSASEPSESESSSSEPLTSLSKEDGSCTGVARGAEGRLEVGKLKHDQLNAQFSYSSIFV